MTETEWEKARALCYEAGVMNDAENLITGVRAAREQIRDHAAKQVRAHLITPSYKVGWL